MKIVEFKLLSHHYVYIFYISYYISFSIQEFFDLEIRLHSEDNRRIKTYKLTFLILEICVHKYDSFLCCEFTIKTWYKYKPYQTLKLFCITFISYISSTEIIKKDFSMKFKIFLFKNWNMLIILCVCSKILNEICSFLYVCVSAKMQIPFSTF